MHSHQRTMDSQTASLKNTTPNSSLCHFYIVDLSLIAHFIYSGVYVTGSFQKNWGQIETRIALYNKMDSWISGLHPSFSFQGSHSDSLPSMKSASQISLALNYHSCRIVLNRPRLNRPSLEKKTGLRLPRSRFSNLTALACLRASLDIRELLPNLESLDWCYGLLEWWEILHVLTQATIILLLDLAIGPVPTKREEVAVIPQSVDVVLNGAKKGLSWLDCLGRTSMAARRPFNFGYSCITRLATTRDLDLSDIPLPSGPSLSPWSGAEAQKMSSTQENEPGIVADHSKSTRSPLRTRSSNERLCQHQTEI